jgi:hypothetical protein
VGETTSGFIGWRYPTIFRSAPGGGAEGAGPPAPSLGSSSTGVSFIPQMGQFSGLSDTICGCIEHWYFCFFAPPA